MTTLRVLTCAGRVDGAVGQRVDRHVAPAVGRIRVDDFDGVLQLHRLRRRIIVGQRRVDDMLLLLLVLLRLADKVRLANTRHQSVVVSGDDGAGRGGRRDTLVHRGGGPGAVDQVLLLLFLRRGRGSCDSIAVVASQWVTPVGGRHDRRVGDELAFQRHHDCTERVFVHVLTEYFLQKLD